MRDTERITLSMQLAPAAVLDAAEGMLDDLATPVEDFRPRLQPRGHPVEHRLVFQTRNPAPVGGTARPERTDGARRRIAVIDLPQIPQLAFVVRRKSFSGRTNVHILVRIIPELVLAEKTFAHRRSALRLGNMGRQPRLFAGLDVLDLEVAAIGDDIDILDIENDVGRLGGLFQ
jgi:hypothetical protein